MSTLGNPGKPRSAPGLPIFQASGAAKGAFAALWFGLGLAAALWLSGIISTRSDQPLSLRGDHLFLLVQIKSFLHGYGLRFNPSLGFPGVQDNLLFPQFDLSYRLVLYLLSKFSDSLFLIDHLIYRISIAAMFASSFLMLRVLGVRSWLAAIASVVYVVSPYFALRSLRHDFLALYFGVPWGAGLAYLLAEREALSKDRPRFFAALFGACVVIAGTSGLYYAFFAAMFVCVTAVGCTIGRRDARPVVLGAITCVALLLLVLVSGYRWHIPEFVSGALPQPRRGAIENLYYGLLISDSVHVLNEIGLFRSSFQQYVDGLTTVTGANFLFEWPGPLLSTVIVAAPALLLVVLFDRERQQRVFHARLIWLSLFLIAFGLIYATRGGLGFLFSYLVTPAIRAPARIIPFLSFFALVAVCCMIELLLARRTLTRMAGAAVVVVILAGGLAIKPFPVVARQQAMLAGSDLMENQASLAAMLTRKDQADLRRILQLPHTPWPEAPHQRGFEIYQHQMPYLLDRADSETRWSYGLTARQPQFGIVEAMVRDGLTDFPARARAAGFDAALVEKRAYSDKELLDLSERIQSGLSPGCRIFEDDRRALYTLNKPSDQAMCVTASRPLARDTRLTLSFSARAPHHDYLVEGWSEPESSATWSGPASRLYVPLPSRTASDPVALRLTLGLYRPDPAKPKTIIARIGDRTIGTLVAEPQQALPPDWRIVLPADLLGDRPGIVLNFEVLNAESPRDYGSDDTRVLGFWLGSAELETVP